MHAAVAGWLLGSGPSGANRRLCKMLEAMPGLLGEGERITLLHAPGQRPGLPSEIECQPVDIRPGPTMLTLLRFWRQERVLRRVLRDLGATVLEQGFLPVGGSLPCPLSLTVHDLRDLGEFRRRPSWLARLGLVHGLRRAAAVTVPSQFTADQLTAAFGTDVASPPVVIGNGVDERFFALDTRGGAGGQRFFLHVGHLERRKNIAVLLEAWRLLGDAAPILVLAGAPVDARTAAALRRLATDRVCFLGGVDEDHLLELYATCEALLMPSLYEGFGLPALEALAAGKPVWVSDAAALPEVVGDAGTVLPARDPGAWARAVTGLEEGSAAAGRAGRQDHARQYTWSRCAEATLDLWRELSLRRRDGTRAGA